MKFLRCSHPLPAVAVVAGCWLALLPACSLLHRHPKAAAAVTTTDPQAAAVVGKTNARGLTVELKSSPDPLKLGEVRQIDVTFSLHNNTKKAAELKFPTSQTIEILLRDPATGKILSQWSTDQTFQPNARYLVVNPRERVEYSQPITTRELHPGKTYSLEAYFVGYDKDLRASRPIIPLP